MIKRLFVLALISLLMISCEKTDSPDPLTTGKWILDSGPFSTTKETLQFNTQGSYRIESEITLPRRVYFLKGSISGIYQRQDDTIRFRTSRVELPEDTSSVTLFPYETGRPAGGFYGSLANGIYQNDSSLVDSTGNVRFSDLGKSGIFFPENTVVRKWIIISLTADTLLVKANLLTNRYLKKPPESILK